MKEFFNKLYIMILMAAANAKKVLEDERGETNIIAIILVLAIVIALALVFKNSLLSLFNQIWTEIVGDVSGVI